MTSKIYLGLDISTSSTGWALIDGSGNAIDIGWFSISKIEGLNKKADEVEIGLKKIQKPDGIFIEENVLGFSRGASSAGVIVTLAKFNAIVSNICWKLWGIEPVSIPAIRARSLVGLKVPRGENVKEHVLHWAKNKSDEKFWPTKVLKTGKRKGQVIPVQGCFDAADAFLLATAGLKTIKQ